MSNRLKIKIHDVLHEKEDFDANAAEEYIESWITGVDVVDVRIATGPKNSPLFVTVDQRSLYVDDVMMIARSAVTGFSEFVDGVNVDTTVRDDNVKLIAEEN